MSKFFKSSTDVSITLLGKDYISEKNKVELSRNLIHGKHEDKVLLSLITRTSDFRQQLPIAVINSESYSVSLMHNGFCFSGNI